MNKRVLGIGIAVVLAAGCVPKKKYNAQVELARKLQEQLNTANERNKELGKKLGFLDKQVAELRKAMKTMEEDSIRLRQRFRQRLQATQKELQELARKRREAEAQARMFQELTAKFRKLIDAGTLSITIVHGRMVLKLKSAILFDSGKDKLRRAGKDTLAAIAEVLKTINGKHFQVAGHTDDRPVRHSRYKDNWWLSVARAVRVVEYLQKQGVPPQNLSAAGFSQYQPVAPNRSPEGRKQNRRIEITLLPSIPRQLLGK